MSRKRVRQLGIQIGYLPTGKFNSICDVPGLKVGLVMILHHELVEHQWDRIVDCLREILLGGAKYE